MEFVDSIETVIPKNINPLYLFVNYSDKSIDQIHYIISKYDTNKTYIPIYYKNLIILKNYVLFKYSKENQNDTTIPKYIDIYNNKYLNISKYIKILIYIFNKLINNLHIYINEFIKNNNLVIINFVNETNTLIVLLYELQVNLTKFIQKLYYELKLNKAKYIEILYSTFETHKLNNNKLDIELNLELDLDLELKYDKPDIDKKLYSNTKDVNCEKQKELQIKHNPDTIYKNIDILDTLNMNMSMNMDTDLPINISTHHYVM